MNRGTNSPIGGFSPQRMVVHAAALGGGAGVDGTIPSNGQLESTLGRYPKGENFASALKYNAATGVYYVLLTEPVKHILFVSGMVVDSGGAPTGALNVTPISVTPASKRIDINIHTPAGVLTDLGTSDMLVLRCEIADTGAIG